MHAIQLKINDKVYDKFLWLLSKFSKDEVEIIQEDHNYIAVKEYLQEELEDIKNGNAKFIDQVDFESRLDQIV